MKLEAERLMFKAAFQEWAQGLARHYPIWMDHYQSRDYPGIATYTMMRTAGSKFKRCAAAAVCFADDTATLDMLMDYGPTSIMYRKGRVFMYYEDGYDVLAETGALAAFRSKQEDRLLCSG